MRLRASNRARAGRAALKQALSVLCCLLSGLLLQPVHAQEPTKQQKKALEKRLEGSQIKAKIDLPLVKGMVVYPNGELDARIYREKLSNFPVSIHRFETALLRDVLVKDKRIEVKLNAGGLRGHSRNVLKWTDPYKAGTTIKIEFGRKLTSQDLDPAIVVSALRSIVEIDGFSAAAVQPAQNPAVQLPAPATTFAVPEVSLQGIEVQPPKVAPGETVGLIMLIGVKGMVGENRIEVAEERQVFLDGRPLLSAPRVETAAWGNGTHTRSREFAIPAAAPPGVYTFKATVRSGAGVDSKEAVFVVTPSLGGS